jgi:hypothetical protein
VNASSPQSWRLRSSWPVTCRSSTRVTAAGSKKPCRRSRSGESVSCANGSRSPFSQAAAGIEKPRFCRGRSRAAAAARRPCAAAPSCEAAHLLPRRQREREVRHDGVEERHARLERVRHRRAVGLHEQVVDEVDAEVDVLQPREQLGALRLRDSARGRRRRVEAAARPGQLARARRREDLLPAVVALERRQVRARDEALRLVVEARLRVELGSRSTSGRAAARAPTRSASRSADVGVVAAEQLVAALPRQGDLDVGRRQLRDEVGRQRRRVGERARRMPRRAPAGAALRPGGARARGAASRTAPRPRARRRARRTTPPRTRSRTSAPAPTSPAPRAPRARRSRRRPRAAPPTGTSATRCARTESRSRARSSSTSSASSSCRSGSGPGRANRSSRGAPPLPDEQVAGPGSFRTSRKIEYGAGIELKARNASSASRSISPRGSALSSTRSAARRRRGGSRAA